MPLTLAPAVIFPISVTTENEGRSTLTVNCRPEAAIGQRVSLIVSDRELPLGPLNAPSAALTFSGRFPSGRHRVRLRIDGIDSNLVDRTKRPPVFDSAQEVLIP
jgi:hypothetical protein